ncbi:MAG: PAS domain-containing sensor histidine kinase [Ahrensia sp.]|nr:PAS domain-containing sensor histidine kinase [Ahrensia sp.]|tara:strand:- start:17775 stop:19148 length:1374 start_codon:yes stop_codon:yes gene_type:complete
MLTHSHKLRLSTGAPSQPGRLPIGEGGEDVWIDVIQKMDEVYSELVESQTELEEKNARLEEAHAFIGSVLAAMTDVLIVCDTKGQIQQVNPALEATTGRRERDLVGLPVTDLFDEESRAAVAGLLPELKEGRIVAQRDLSLGASDPQKALISVNCTPRCDHRGRLVGMVLVGRPIGELQRAYRELDSAHQKLTQTQQRMMVSEKMAALGRLVAGVAHELNNPISFVFGNMYALKRYGAAITEYLSACDGSGGNPAEMDALRKSLKIDRVLQDIGPLVDGTLEGAERVRDIVQDLRRFSSNQEETAESFNITRLVRTAADWVIKTQRVKPAVRLDIPDKLELRGRKGQLHQIIVNLVQNAADVLEGEPKGEIVVTGERVGGDVVIRVADNGPGIPLERIDKIFEPFFTTKPIGAGTGLGLYVSYNMAMKQGGDLTAANRPEGGAEFTVRVPADDASAA